MRCLPASAAPSVQHDRHARSPRHASDTRSRPRFTQEGRGGVDILPALADDWGPLPGYRWLQHGSSALRLVLIAMWMLVWLRRREAAQSVPCLLPPACALWGLLTLALCVAVR